MNNLIILINEEFNKFITETTNYDDNYIVNPNDINLQNEYDKLNALIFNNELPKITLKFSNRKTSLGHVNTLINRSTGERKINHLAISGFFKVPYKRFKSTLAHEMIHVKQIINNTMGYDAHGSDFLREMNRINNLGLGFDISVFNTEKHELSDKSRSTIKSLIAVVLNLDGKYYLNVTTPKVYNLEGDKIFNLYDKLVKREKYNRVEISVIETTNPKLLPFRITRTYNNGLSYTPLTDDLLNELIEDNIVKEVTFENDKQPIIKETNLPSGEWEEEIIV